MGPPNQQLLYYDVVFQAISTKFRIFVKNGTSFLCSKFKQNRMKNKEVAKIENCVIMTSFLNTARQFFARVALISTLYVLSFKLTEVKIKE